VRQSFVAVVKKALSASGLLTGGLTKPDTNVGWSTHANNAVIQHYQASCLL